MGKEILFIDDDFRFRDSIVPLLLDEGYHLAEAGNGADARKLVKTRQFDLVIVDGTLPDATGINLIAEFRRSLYPARVIFVSAFWRDQESYKRLTQELEVELVLHKPVNTFAFCKQVKELLAKGPWRPRGAGEASSTEEPAPAAAVTAGPPPITVGETATIKAQAGWSVRAPETSQPRTADSAGPRIVDPSMPRVVDPLGPRVVDPLASKVANPAPVSEAAPRPVTSAAPPAVVSAAPPPPVPGVTPGSAAAPASAVSQTPAPASAPAKVPLADRMRAATITFLQELPQDVAEMKSLSQQSCRTSDIGLLSDLRKVAHKLRGTCGTYGQHPLSSSMARLEDYISTRTAGDSLFFDADVWKYIDTTIEEFEKLLQAALDSFESAADSTVSTADRREVLIAGTDETISLLNGPMQSANLAYQHFADSGAFLNKAFAMRPSIVFLDAAFPNSFLLGLKLREQATEPNLVLLDSDTGFNPAQSLYLGVAERIARPFAAQEIERVCEKLSSVASKGQLKVLAVDDDKAFLANIAETLRKEDFKFVGITDPLAAFDTAGVENPDVILLDAEMPQISGFDVCRRFRSMKRWESVPVMFVTQTSGKDGRLATYEAGADDYLEKPLSPEELLLRIKNRVERTKALTDKLKYDALTGLLTAPAFSSAMSTIIDESAGPGYPIAVGMIKFHNVADKQGADALRTCAQVLSRRFRRQDVRGRSGEDELAVILPNVNDELAKQGLKLFLTECKQRSVAAGAGDLAISASVVVFPGNGVSDTELLSAARRSLSPV